MLMDVYGTFIQVVGGHMFFVGMTYLDEHAKLVMFSGS